MRRSSAPRPYWKNLRNSGTTLIVVGLVVILVSGVMAGRVEWPSFGFLLSITGGMLLVVSFLIWLRSRTSRGTS